MTATTSVRKPKDVAPRETVAALIDLDRAIRRADPPPTSLRIVGWVFLAFIAVGVVALTMVADEGTARRTTAAVFSFVAIAGMSVAPLIASRPSGVAPTDVRHLPVSAAALRAASTRVMVRGHGLIAVLVALLVVPLAWFTDPNAGLVAQIVGTAAILPAAGIGVLGPRVLGLVFANAMRTQTGRIVSTVVSVIAIAAVYVVYLLLSQGIVDPRNETLQIAARVVPTGWPVVAGEALDAGRWWLTVLAIAGLFAIIGLLYRVWVGRIDQAMYADAIGASASSRTRENARPITSSPTLLVVRTEARMLVTDPQRLGLAIMPLTFIVIGVVLMLTGSDVYGMQYGAPAVVYMCGGMLSNTYGLDRWGFAVLVTDPQRLGLAIMPLTFIVIGVVLMLTGSDVYGMQYGAPAVIYMCGGMLSNTYGLDRWGFAVLVTSPSAAPLVVRARMVLAALLAIPVGVIGTAVARAIRHTDPGTWPVAVSVIIGGSATAAAMAALLPALCPYRVPQGSSISSMSSRGSMSGSSLGLALSAIPAMALVCAPGIALGLLLDGPLAYIAVAVEVVVAAPVTVIAYRRAVALVAERGPEILTTVTSTAAAEPPKKDKKKKQ